MHFKLQSGFSPGVLVTVLQEPLSVSRATQAQTQHLRGYHHRGQCRDLREPFGAGLENSLQKVPTHLGNPKQQCPGQLGGCGFVSSHSLHSLRCLSYSVCPVLLVPPVVLRTVALWLSW